MSLMAWLFGSNKKALSRIDREIEKRSKSIEEMDKGIEALEPVVKEAVRRTDDVYYKLRSEVARAERRKEKTEADLSSFVMKIIKGMDTVSGDAVLRDMRDGWGKKE